MPRIRTIKPSFWRSPSTGHASPWARLLYIAMWNWADDWGRAEWTPRELLGFAFPHDTDDPCDDLNFPTLVQEVSRKFSIKFYRCGERRFYAVDNWDEHQKVPKRVESKFPAPDDPECVPDKEVYGESWKSQNFSGTFLTTSEKVGTGSKEVGSKEVGINTLARPASKSLEPDRFDEFWAVYPRKAAKAKARTKFATAVKKVGAQTVIDGATRYAADPNLPEQQYIPHPTTWLEQGRWDDPPLPARHDRRQTATNGLTDDQWSAAFERAKARDEAAGA